MLLNKNTNLAVFAQKSLRQIVLNERGSVLIISLLIMAVLAVLGAVASNMSITEMRVAANDRAYNQAFYVADGGWQMVPLFLTDEIKNARDPSNVDLPSLTTTMDTSTDPPTPVALAHDLGAQKFTLDITETGNRKCRGGGGKNCREFLYQVDSNALNAAGNEVQRIRVRIAAPFTNIGYSD